jgi:hypothetical protein
MHKTQVADCWSSGGPLFVNLMMGTDPASEMSCILRQSRNYEILNVIRNREKGLGLMDSTCYTLQVVKLTQVSAPYNKVNFEEPKISGESRKIISLKNKTPPRQADYFACKENEIYRF